MDERRGEKRVSKAVFVRFGLSAPEHAGVADELSSSGLSIRSETLFPIQTLLQIELHLSDDLKTVAFGQVTWVKDLPQASAGSDHKGMGIRLTRIPHEYHTFIKALQA